MTIADLVREMEAIAPTPLAESWDNVGLLVGDPAASLRRVLLTIDYTAEVASEAVARHCDAVVAYHPPIFSPLKHVRAGHPVFEAIRNGIALYSPHTALDLADGGTNDVLAEVLGLEQARPLVQKKEPATPWHYKLVTFVPAEHLETVAESLFSAGAGHIGNYSHCSYRMEGTGTFLPHQGASPAIGQVGKFEQTRETRIETLVPANRLDAVIAALRQSHPYEEPAFDVVQLTAPPVALGMGRIGRLPGVSRKQLLQRIKASLGVRRLLVAGPITGRVKVAACAAGSCGPLFKDALAQGAGLYLTGELKHHDALAAAAGGMTVVCALHSNSERVALQRVAERLAPKLPRVKVMQSRKDRDAFVID
jgi:dinuclear metal center YbgI/SA1388 family protein